MKSFDTELKKYSEKISLKMSERQALRERILSYMEYHPLPKQVLSKEDLVFGLPSESFTTFHFTFFHARIAASALVVVLILAPFVAERSVPGDVLYLVKTGINENFEGQLVNSPYEKIEFETKLMERRIAEARSLAQDGKLTEEVKTQIESDVKEHSIAVRSGLEELRTQDVDGAAIAEIAFNSTLEVQAAVLDADKGVETKPLMEDLLTVVVEARGGGTMAMAKVADGNQPSWNGLTAQVERETTRAQELFNSIKESATDEEIRDIERRLSDINRLVAEARGIQRRDESRGISDLSSTLGLTNKLIAFMTDIDVRKTVALETLVPVVLSAEERTVIAKREIESIGLLTADVTTRLETITDPDMRAKIEDGLSQVKVLTLDANLSLDAADVGTAEGKLFEAGALLADLGTISTVGNNFAEGEGAVDPSTAIMMTTIAPEEGEVVGDVPTTTPAVEEKPAQGPKKGNQQ